MHEQCEVYSKLFMDKSVGYIFGGISEKKGKREIIKIVEGEIISLDLLLKK